MRMEIQLSAMDDNRITLPLHYNKAVQGLIYRQISEYMPELHDNGYVIDKRVFRLFVFSRVQGAVAELRNGRITFKPPVTIKVSSTDSCFLELLGNRLLKARQVSLDGCSLLVDTVAIRRNPDFSSGIAKVKAISPITVYSTMTSAVGSKKTYYYHPREREFAEQIKNNLLKKAAILGLHYEDGPFSIEPVHIRNTDLKVVYYDNFIIKGWLGMYVLKGIPQLLEIAYDTGIGAKNPQGFGMIETV